MNEIEKTFEITTKMLFGKSFGPIENYSFWLEKRIPKSKKYKSALSDREVLVKDYYFFKEISKEKIAIFEELNQVGQRKMNLNDVSIEEVKKKIGSTAMFVPDFRQGKNINVTNSVVYIDCMNVDNSFDTFSLKNSAYIFSAFGEGLFGSYRLVNSKFSIHCYNVTNINSCFEIDTAKNCSNSMFCHNVENVHDSIFCFNTKSKRYAVGNIEIGKEKYFEIRKKLCEKIIEGLEKNKDFEIDIYNLLEKK